MITCSRCGKENQDHYKFCLGCGAKLEAAAAAAAPAPAPVPAPGLTPPPAATKPPEKASVPLGMAKTAVPPAGSTVMPSDYGGRLMGMAAAAPNLASAARIEARAVYVASADARV